MAAKRIAQSSFNWAALAERVPEHQRAQYIAFKTKSDNYIRRMMSNPEKPPAIDWQYYGNTVPVPGLVEEFKKKYDSFQIPVPPVDTQLSQIAELEKSVNQDIASFKAESDQRIAAYQEEIKKLEAQIPYDQMTYEELAIINLAPNGKSEFFWPDYVEEKKAEGH